MRGSWQPGILGLWDLRPLPGALALNRPHSMIELARADGLLESWGAPQ